MSEVEIHTYVDTDAVSLTVSAPTPKEAVQLLLATLKQLVEAGVKTRHPIQEHREPWER